jgi:hypothetical protein
MAEIQTLNIFSSFALCGLIWTIQLVHYPFFNFIEPSRFDRSMAFHQKRISTLVIPLMVAELVTSAMLVLYCDSNFILHLAGLIAVLLIWLITFLFMVPLHKRLTEGYSPEIVQMLTRSNWARTLLWSLKSLLGISLLVNAL